MTRTPHATVAAIIERDDKFLMVEETAWVFTPEFITGIYLWKHPKNQQTFLRVAFCGSCDQHKPGQRLDDGIEQAVWKSREQLTQDETKLRSPMVLKCIDDYLAGKRYPLDMLIHLIS